MSDDPYEDIHSETGWSRSVIRLMASAVAVARKRNSWSWTIYPHQGAAVLHVGKRSACILHPETVQVFVDANTVDRKKLNSLGIQVMARPVEDFKEQATIEFPTSSAAEIVPLVEATHLEIVQKFARIKADQNKGDLYEDSFRRKLNEVGNAAIPRPFVE